MNTLKLTEADIEAAQRQAQAQPPVPPVLTIGAADLADAPPPQTGSARLQITEQDLQPVPPQSSGSPDLARYEQLMFRLINEARSDQLPDWLGGGVLRWHDGLAAVARGHSNDMLQRGYVAHETPEGVSAAKRIERYGVGYIACGENIGVVYGDASHSDQGIHEIHRTFMKQPRRVTNHRGNLLNPIWTHVGIGVAYRPRGALVVTQNFMSAPGSWHAG